MIMSAFSSAVTLSVLAAAHANLLFHKKITGLFSENICAVFTLTWFVYRLDKKIQCVQLWALEVFIGEI